MLNSLRRRAWLVAVAVGAAAAVPWALSAGPARAASTTERVSLSSTGEEGSADSRGGVVSADGRYVAFVSGATNLVPGDTNRVYDVFVRDRTSGSTERASVNSAGEQAQPSAPEPGLPMPMTPTVVGDSSSPAISADGRYVAFTSNATNLVPDDSNNASDVFVRDRATGSTERVSVDSAGIEADGASVLPAISADGRFVAFGSDATNLVPDDTNASGDVFVHDRLTGLTERVSVSNDGSQADAGSGRGSSISGDGRFVAFGSDATNLVPDDTDGKSDVFVRDRQTGTTERVSVDSDNGQANDYSYINPGAISGDGRFVAFTSPATNLVPDDTNATWDVFVRDRETASTERVSVGPGGVQGDKPSFNATISADGRTVAFQSLAGNILSEPQTFYSRQLFVHDRATGVNEQLDLGYSGEQPDGGASEPGTMSADGTVIGFDSPADNLVPGDTNGVFDVFVRLRQLAAPPSTTTTEPPTTTTEPPTTTTSSTTTTQPQKVATTLVARAIAMPTLGKAAFSATLTATATGVPIPGEVIRFSVHNKLACTATTTATGRASCGDLSKAIQAIQAQGYDAFFAGDSQYLPSTAHGGLT